MASRLWRTTPDYSSLPDEIKEQMFLKIQCIKSIVTCMSVCKSWYAVIKSPGFITTQLSAPNNNTEYYLCSYFIHPYYSIQYYDSERLQNYYDLIFPNENRVIVHGSCNGLICYAGFNDDDSGNMYLWNPTIRKLKVLPKSKYSAKRTACGFWFDTNSDDYKVAKISCAKRFKVEVYNLRSNSWDIVSTSGPRCSRHSSYYNVVHLNGTLYWLTSNRHKLSIVSINTKNGMFQDTLIRRAQEGVSRIVFNTFQARGSLFVLINSYRFLGQHVYDESLNELYRKEVEKSDTEIIRPLGVRNNGNDEVLFQRIGNDPPILACNIGELKFKDFSPSTRTIGHLLPFVETLVLLDDGDSSSTSNTQ